MGDTAKIRVAELWWPPLYRLCERLQELSVDRNAQGLQDLLREYEPCLARGLGHFQGPSGGSRKAIEGEASLSIGAKKLPVEAPLRQEAFAVSSLLSLDEIQSYVLLRRWLSRPEQADVSLGKETLVLTPEQRQGVAALYAQERSCLLQAIEDLLWLGEVSSEAGAFSDGVEAALSSLLDAGLEDATFKALEANLAPSSSSGGAAPSPGMLLLPGASSTAVVPFSLPLATPSFRGGHGRQLALFSAKSLGARPGALSTGQDGGALERCSLLNVLILIYYHPRRQCTSDRFLALARLFNRHLFSRLPPPVAGAGVLDASPAHLSVKLATVLLLEMLGVDKPVTALAEGVPLTQDGYAFAGVGVRAAVHAELASWWPAAGPPHAAVLLAWASVLCIVGKAQQASGGAAAGAASAAGGDWEGHAVAAQEAGAWGALAMLARHHSGVRVEAAEMLNNVLLGTLGAVICAFDFRPASLPLPATTQAVDILVDLFTDQPFLCEGFWAGDRVADEPLRAFLEDLTALFPALPVPLYRLLAALAPSQATAAAANGFLTRLLGHGLVSAHVLPDWDLREDPNTEGQVVTSRAKELPGARVLTLPEGTVGEVVPLPEGIPGAEALWALPPGEDLDSASLVRWRLSLAEGAAHCIALCRAFEALALVQRAAEAGAGSGGDGRAAAALEELGAALHLAAMLALHDPSTGVHLLHVEEPTGGETEADMIDDGEGQAVPPPGRDLLTLACQALTVLSQLAEPPMAIIGDCFTLCAALAQGIPGRVLSELSGVLQLKAYAKGDDSLALPQEIPLLEGLLAAESAAGRFPATLSFLRLSLVLVSAGAPSPALGPLVAFVLRRVLAQHATWQYAARADRWRVASTALRVVRQALLAGPPAGAGGGAPGATPGATAAACAALRFDVGLAACLFPALPPDASTLKGMDERFDDEVPAAEECAREWLRLLPVLLPPGAPDAMLAPGAFFRETERGGSTAALLLSYLLYPYFVSGEQALAMRAAHCLAAAAAKGAPTVAMASLLPSDDAVTGPSKAVRAALADALSPQAAADQPALFNAACDMVAAAARAHPSLLDAMMFPSALGAQRQKENRNGNYAGDAKPALLALPAPPGSSGSAPKQPKAAATPPHSCLDALWALLQRAPELRREHPAALAKALQAVAALWQEGGATLPQCLLRGQPAFWSSLGDLLREAAAEGPVGAPEDLAHPEGWEALGGAASRLAAEAHALQIVACEAYLWEASPGNGAGAPAEFVSVSREVVGGLGAGLLGRYARPLPTPDLLARLYRHAAGAGLQALGWALGEPAIWRSLAEGSSVVLDLHAAAQPLLRTLLGPEQRGRSGAAACALAAAAAAPEQPLPAGAAPVAEALLRLAMPPERVAADRELGRGYVYDSALFSRRMGAVLTLHLGQVQELRAWLDAAGVGASLEDARLAALTACKVLAGSRPGRAPGTAGGKPLPGGSAKLLTSGGGDAPTAEGMEAAWESVGLAVERLSREEEEAGRLSLAAGRAEGAAARAAGSGIDLPAAHLASAAEAAQVAAMQLRRWCAAARGRPATAATAQRLAVGLLGAVQRALGLSWKDLAAWEEAAGEAHDSLLQALLAAALLALSACPADAGGAAPVAGRREAAEPRLVLQAAAAAALPALLGACHKRPAHLLLSASLVTMLLERALPPDTWLPLVRAHVSLGLLLSQTLQILAAKQAGGAAGQHPQPAGPDSPAAAGSAEEAVLGLALQVAQVPAGARVLSEQGVVPQALALARWLLAPSGGALMSESPRQPQRSGAAAGSKALVAAAPKQQARAPVDYANVYRQDGAPSPAHRLWCSALGLMGLMLASLPGHGAVEEAALQLAVEAEPRLLLAVEPPAATPQQPVTLAMLQETKYSLFLLCGLARVAGQWRLLLPDGLPAFRQASASLLSALAVPAPIQCAPVSPEERAAAAVAEGPEIAEGWFAACAGDWAPRRGASAAEGYSWQLAERLYSCAQYALAFQLAVAPEVGEEEAGSLGPEWPEPSALAGLLQQSVDVAMAASSPGLRQSGAARRVARTVRAVIGGAMQLQDRMGETRSHGQTRNLYGILQGSNS